VLGEEHRNTLMDMNNLAVIYRSQGKDAEAEALLTRAVDLQRRVLGEQHPYTLLSMSNLGVLYRDHSRYAESEPLLSRALEQRRRVLGETHPDTLRTANDLGSLYLSEAKFAEAEVLLRQALASHEKASSTTWRRYETETLLGASLAGQKSYSAAETFLLSGFEGLTKRKGNIPIENQSIVAQAGERVARLYEDWGKPAKAAEWRKQMQGQ
jgi:tetratricopeptide (TPR) repeat protein